jgi:ketosteroid isomerase-like protein
MKKQIKLFGILAGTLLILSACATTEKEEALDMEKVRIEIQAMEDAFTAGEKAKDADAVAAYYSDDAISYSRNSTPLSGKVAITANISNNMEKDTLGNYSVYKLVNVFAEGDTAIEVGSWIQFNASGKEVDNGNFMSYFQKRNGKYLCVRDMSTTTSPVKSGM